MEPQIVILVIPAGGGPRYEAPHDVFRFVVTGPVTRLEVDTVAPVNLGGAERSPLC